MFFHTSDPILDLYRSQAYRSRGCVCDECKGGLEDKCFEIDRKFICEDCFDEAFKVFIDEDVECAYCGEMIQDDTAFKIDGDFVCEKCVNEDFKTDSPEFD